MYLLSLNQTILLDALITLSSTIFNEFGSNIFIWYSRLPLLSSVNAINELSGEGETDPIE